MLTSDLLAHRHTCTCAHTYANKNYKMKEGEKFLCCDSGMQGEGTTSSVSQMTIHCGPQCQLRDASDVSALLCFLGNCCPCLLNSPFLLAFLSSLLSLRPLQ